MKKVVVIATYFPPAGGIATFRITKFVKFLPRFDWQPIVLTVKEDAYKECGFLIDNTLSKDLANDLTIYRTDIGAEPSVMKGLRKGLPTRWLKPLFAIIGSLIKNERPDLLFATGDPFFPLLVAPFAKVRYGLNYVIDLRDPWKLAIKDNPIPGLKGKIFTPLNNFLEPLVLNRASKVIVVSEKMAEDYRAAYPKRPANDFIVIPNGYDPNDYDCIPAVALHGFTVTYAGKFLSGKSFRNPEPFFKALNILKESGVIINFRYIGEPNPQIDNLAEQHQLSDRYQPVGYLSYSETIANMKGSDVLLLIGSGQETEQTGKIFDYLGCKRPILALASQRGGIADVVAGIEQVALTSNDSPETIAQLLLEFYQGRSEQPIERDGISGYLREHLTERLADVFNEISS
ncbi:glycosyltransferase [Pedobacter faecalis]|uniref:glycosyltransferase n=1 Tax=Pedobacter faecalis TaxID=3041495 RepID=UPI00254A09D4|nr:glycosyltransferase [Pedobacter sp. ELA7]